MGKEQKSNRKKLQMYKILPVWYAKMDCASSQTSYTQCCFLYDLENNSVVEFIVHLFEDLYCFFFPTTSFKSFSDYQFLSDLIAQKSTAKSRPWTQKENRNREFYTTMST